MHLAYPQPDSRPAMNNPTIRSRRSRQQGLTLVELMVGVVLALLVTLAATGALLASRQGFASVDATSQLRDNARFTTQLIKRVVEQAGYEDHNAVNAVTNTSAVRWSGITPDPFVSGYDNVAATMSDSGPQYANGGVNGSDVLVVRYQGSSAASVGATAADGSIIDCAGFARAKTTDPSKLVQSILYVKNSSDEPSLMCGYRSDDGKWNAQPLIPGVETLQVRYGVATATPVPGKSGTDLPEQYVSASDLNIGTPAARTANWQRVKAVRIGMVMRGAPSSAFDLGNKTADKQAAVVFYPLGDGMHSGADAGTEFQPPPDGRLRQLVTFTVYLRNPQSW